mgnify:CR=1 FL=1
MTVALPSARAWLPGLAGIVVAGAAGYAFSRLRTPIPWMLGPLTTVAVLRVLGLPIDAPPGAGPGRVDPAARDEVHRPEDDVPLVR